MSCEAAPSLLSDIQQLISFHKDNPPPERASGQTSDLHSQLWVFPPQTKDIVCVCIEATGCDEMFNLVRLCAEQTRLAGAAPSEGHNDFTSETRETRSAMLPLWERHTHTQHTRMLTHTYLRSSLWLCAHLCSHVETQKMDIQLRKKNVAAKFPLTVTLEKEEKAQKEFLNLLSYKFIGLIIILIFLLISWLPDHRFIYKKAVNRNFPEWRLKMTYFVQPKVQKPEKKALLYDRSWQRKANSYIWEVQTIVKTLIDGQNSRQFILFWTTTRSSSLNDV